MQTLILGVIGFSAAVLAVLLFIALDVGGRARRLVAALRAAAARPAQRRGELAGGASTSRLTPAARPDRQAPPGSPQFELQGRKEVLQAQAYRLARRTRWLAALAAAGAALLLAAGGVLYQTQVRAYAVLEDVAITRHPADQGRVEVRFRVVTPGKVHYRRTSGAVETEMIDYFSAAAATPQQRLWAWAYEPGQDVDVRVQYRGGLWRAVAAARFPTACRADVVVLMDTTGSMSRSIAQLKEKCVAFSEQLTRQQLEHRFALVGFGDTREGDWLDVHPFTADASQFRQEVERLRRFDGGDLRESALDALEAALELPLGEDSLRRFYLVTDAAFHEPTAKGATTADLVTRLAERRVLLSIFSRPELLAEYGPLMGATGKFQDLAAFGQVLTEGRILED